MDDVSKYTWLYPITHKYDVYSIFQIFKPLFENELSLTIKKN